MEFNAINIVDVLTLFISALFALYIFTAKTEKRLNNILIALFLLFSAIDASWLLGKFIYPSVPGFGLILSLSVTFAFPLLYLYIISLIYSDFKLKSRHLLHGVPFVVGVIIFTPRFFSVDYNGKMEFLMSDGLKQTIEMRSIYIIIHTQIFAYLVASYFAVRKYKLLLHENFSNASLVNYKWMFQLIALLGIEALIGSTKNVFMFLDIASAYEYTKFGVAIFVLGFICWLVLRALQNPELFRGVDSELQLIGAGGPRIEQINIEATEVKDRATKMKLDRLNEYMIAEEPYLDPGLSISDLANQIHMNPRELSQLINNDMNQHFFDFVNSYRIKKAKQLLTDPDKDKFTVLEILYDVGFNSKSSFNTVFKKFTNLTPTEYRKRHFRKAA